MHSKIAPKSVLLFHRLDYDWFNPLLIKAMRERFGTRFVVIVNSEGLVTAAKRWCSPQDKVIAMTDIQRRTAVPPEDEAAVFEYARKVEAQLGLTYLRDIIQQDRSVSAYYLQYAPNSAWSTKPSKSLAEQTAEINDYERYFRALLRDEKIDLVIERPGAFASTVCLHLAMSLGIPTTFTLPSRFKSYVMWSFGPYLDSRLLVQAHGSVSAVPPVPQHELQPPDDSAKNIARSQELRSTKTLLKNVARAVVNHLIWAWRDLKRWRRGKRLPLSRVIRNHLSVYLTYRFLERNSVSDVAELAKRPFVLFLLQLEPEFTTLSLAREFNNTKAVVQQLALSLPSGYRLVLKEHVTSIGNRALNFYSDLLQLPNVVMADYRLRGLDLAASAAAISTISGTIGTEAAVLGKQAILFAEHVEYAFLPNVHVVTAMGDLPDIVKKVVRTRSEAEIQEVRIAGACYREALKRISFDAPGTRIFRGSNVQIEPEQLTRAVDLLVETFVQQKVRPLQSTKVALEERAAS